MFAQLKLEKGLHHTKRIGEFNLHLRYLPFFSNEKAKKGKRFVIRRRLLSETLGLLSERRYVAVIGLDEELLTLRYLCEKQNISCPPLVMTTLDPHFTQLETVGNLIGYAFGENRAREIALSEDVFWFYPVREFYKDFVDYGIRPENLSYFPSCSFYQKIFSDEYEEYATCPPEKAHEVTEAVRGKILAAGSFNRDYVTFAKACAGLSVEACIVAKMETVYGTAGLRRADLKAALDAAPNVRLFGAIPLAHYTDCLRHAGIVVVPLAKDDFVTGHLTISSAQMLGKCVVAADLPTARDYIEHGKTGLLYEPSNPDSLREQLCFALRNEELVRTIGENGRRSEDEISLSARDSFLSLVRKAASTKT